MLKVEPERTRKRKRGPKRKRVSKSRPRPDGRQKVNHSAGGRTEWRDEMYLKVYFLARSGLSDNQIAGALGVGKTTLGSWVKSKPALREALEKGRSRVKVGYGNKRKLKGKAAEGEKFFEYVYKRLPSELRDLWDELERAEGLEDPEARIAALLEDEGKRTRQHLWVHALVMSNFSESEACRKTMTSISALEGWKRDRDFQNLIDQIHVAKKDFYEESLVALVGARDPSVVVFANRTLNADRGYDPARKVSVSVEGELRHRHEQFPVEEILKYLPVEKQREWLDLLRAARREAAKALPARDITHLVEALPAE